MVNHPPRHPAFQLDDVRKLIARPPSERPPAAAVGEYVQRLHPSEQDAEAAASSATSRELPAALREAGRRREHRAGASLVDPASPSACLHWVERGLLREFRAASDGSELTLRLVGPGRFAGDPGVLLGRPDGSRIEARTDSVVWAVPGDALLAEAGRTPSVLGSVLPELVSRLEATERLAESLALRSARARIAGRLAELAREHGRPCRTPEHPGLALDLPVTHEDLATLASTTRQTVSQELSWLRDQDILRGQRGRDLCIIDIGSLDRVADRGE